MGQEYRLSTGMKIFYGALAVGMFIFSMVLFDMYNPVHGAFVLAIPTGVLIGAILIMASVMRRKIVVYTDSLLYVSLFSKKELSFQEIKGYRLGEKIIKIESASLNVPKITISNFIDFANSDELTDFIKQHFKDLDAIDLENEKNKLLQDSSIGFTEQERNENLVNAKEKAIAYNLAGIMVFIAGLCFDNKVISIILILYPLIGIIFMLFSKGLIKFLSETKRSAYRYIGIGFGIGTAIIFVKTLKSYNIFDFNNLWVPLIATSLILLITLCAIGLNKSIGSIIGQIIFMLVISVIYCFASIIEVNCAFDDSELKMYPAEILDHRVQHGKSTSYYLTIKHLGT